MSSGAAVVLLSGGGVEAVGSGWWWVAVSSCVGGAEWVGKVCSCGAWVGGVLGLVCASSLWDSGVCVPEAVGAGAAEEVEALMGSVLLVAGVGAVWPRTPCSCREAKSSDQRTSWVWKSSMRSKASGGSATIANRA